MLLRLNSNRYIDRITQAYLLSSSCFSAKWEGSCNANCSISMALHVFCKQGILGERLTALPAYKDCAVTMLLLMLPECRNVSE